MGILDGIVEWIAEQVMHGLDLINTSVLGALGCDMSIFLRYFPAAETMYEIFVALAIGLILLIWVWNLVKNFGLGIGSEAEDPVKLSIRAVVFILLAYCASLDCAEQMDRGLLAAVWVLIDFIEQVEYLSDFPAKIIFFAEGEVYEIIYVGQGKETMISHLLSVPREEPSKYIVLVEDLSQIQQLDLPPVSGFCTVSSTGEVQYYKKE